MIVERIMTREVAYCHPTSTLQNAVRLMADHDCGLIPVIENGALVGVVTDRDAALAGCERNERLSDICVGDVMSSRVRVCHPNDEIATVEQQMQLFKVRRIPVVDENERLIGMVSLDDVAMAADRGQDKPGFPTAAEVAHTLASICKPEKTSEAVEIGA